MSKWDEFKKSVGVIADKTVTKTRELTDTASLKLKIASKEADRDSEYKKLGKLTYTKLKNDIPGNAEALTREISESIDKLDKIFAELEALKKEEADRRAAKEAEKASRKEADGGSEKDVVSNSSEVDKSSSPDTDKSENSAE